jgi:hypothetical protein
MRASTDSFLASTTSITFFSLAYVLCSWDGQVRQLLAIAFKETKASSMLNIWCEDVHFRIDTRNLVLCLPYDSTCPVGHWNTLMKADTYSTPSK